MNIVDDFNNDKLWIKFLKLAYTDKNMKEFLSSRQYEDYEMTINCKKYYLLKIDYHNEETLILKDLT